MATEEEDNRLSGFVNPMDAFNAERTKQTQPTPGYSAPLQPTAPKAQKPRKNRFINFSEYAEANKQGAQNMANSFLQPAQAQVNAANQGLGAAARDYSTLVGNYQSQFKPGTVTAAASNRDNTAAISGLQGIQAQAEEAAGLGGLADRQDYKDALGQLEEAGKTTDLFNTQEGRGALLRDRSKSNKDQYYSEGSEQLDAALMGGAAGGAMDALRSQVDQARTSSKFAEENAKRQYEELLKKSGEASKQAGEFVDFRKGVMEQDAAKAKQVDDLKAQITELNRQIGDPGTNPVNLPGLVAQRDAIMKQYNTLTGSGWSTDNRTPQEKAAAADKKYKDTIAANPFLNAFFK